MSEKLGFIKPGIIFGQDIQRLFQIAKKKKFAIPAINCANIDTINIVLETASKLKSPVIIQFSYGGAEFIAGKGLKNISSHEKATLGAISAAHHVHKIAKYYQIPVILHTDHCHKSIMPWLEQLIKLSEENFECKGYPIFSSHMLDLSTETIKDNIKLCKNFLNRMKKINMFLEIELGCTGGEEDGVNNTNINSNLLYTNPKEINYAYEKLMEVGSNFTIAASFGNVHGVYQSGNINLKPEILKLAQKYIVKKHNLTTKNPIHFVFHGGSGSSLRDIKQSINYGVVKMNIDTDIQWAAWNGILQYYKNNKLYLQSQLNNPTGTNSPNKKYYDPRTWIRASQISISTTLTKIFKDLNAINIY